MSNSRKKRKKARSLRNRTPLSGHTRAGKQLTPPLAKMGDKLAFSSWANDRMPDMLWAVIIRGMHNQELAITEFRRILKFVGEHDQREQFSDISLSGIAKLDSDLRKQFITHVVSNPITASALTVFRLFKELPARDDWLKHLPTTEPDVDLLMTSVALNFSHQSQEATDCRWVRLMGQLLSGKFHVPKEMAETWVGYPYVGDQHSVRPSIRAAEIMENPLEPRDTTWPRAFWKEAWENTPCFMLRDDGSEMRIEPSITRARIREVEQRIEEHWHQSHTTTEVDARHDAVFGVALYALRLLDEMIGIGVGVGVLGRLGLRTLVEAYLNLHYLISKDDQRLWKKWRTYGAGQAKLNALRFDTDMDAPKFISTEWLDQMASEDLWEEFLTIELGSWSGLDLRKLSERSGTKDIYDSHYSWTSGYAHSTWGAVRESCFATCGNPLHRLHRYPSRNNLPDTVSDAVMLADLILDELNTAYPGFETRLKG